jgi:error-prone DNA polymerase
VIQTAGDSASGHHALEPAADGRLAVRLGFRMVKGLAATHADEIIARRGAGYRSIEDVWRRAAPPVAALERVAEADGFRSLGLDRRQALWRIRGLSDDRLPLFDGLPGDAAGAPPLSAPLPPETGMDVTSNEPAVPLPRMLLGRQVVEDYRSTGLSLRRHPVSFLRAELDARRIVRCADLAASRDGRRVTVAGIVLVRQRPGSASGVLFMTIEDETAHANLIVWPSLFEAQRRLILSASMVACRGKLQHESGVIHVVAEEMIDLSPLLRSVGQRDDDFPLPAGRGDEARRGSADTRGEQGVGGRTGRNIHVHGRRPSYGIRVPTRDFR